ncbi:ABC transporter permease [Luedemannella helvata]|uniref:ABC-2 type transport system permease protein n=1 Tax=Luedemannella helvata TaxID=349315 RepID=A0ABN2KC59_9ACTN
MRKYVTLAKMQARAVLAYRLNFVLSLFALMFQLFAMLAIWGVMLGSGRTLEGFDWPHMKAYLLVGFLCGALVSQAADWRMAGRIQDGMVAIDLTKPVDYQGARFAEVVGGAWTEIAMALVVCAGVIAFTGPVPGPGWSGGSLFVLSLLAVLPLRFLIVYLSALACFYTQNYLGVHWARLVIVSLFSGALVPLVFFPQWLQSTAAVLPFASMAATPSLVYIGQLRGTEALVMIATQFGWVVVLWLLARLIFRHAIKRVTIHGG